MDYPSPSMQEMYCSVFITGDILLAIIFSTFIILDIMLIPLYIPLYIDVILARFHWSGMSLPCIISLNMT